MVSLRKVSINVRLYFLTFTVTLFMLVPLFLSSIDYKNNLLESKRIETKQLVSVAHSVIQSFYDQATTGFMNEEDAKALAKKAIAAMRYDGSNYYWINDLSATMIMHPIKPQLNGKDLSSLADPNGKYLFKEMVQVASREGSGYVDYQWAKPDVDIPVDKISYISLFKPWGWVIGTGVYVDDVASTYNNFLFENMYKVLISLIIMLPLAWKISQSIVVPAKNSAVAMKDIAEGEGDLTKKLDETGTDELSDIARAFNLFTNKLNMTVNHVKPVTEELLSSAEKFAQVATTAKQNTSEQFRNVDSVAAAMNELLASNQEVAQAASNAALTAEEADKEGLKGIAIVDSTSEHMAELAGSLLETEKNTEALAEQANTISSVVEVIRGIAEQTNLLALNAAIEAARAGEQGRGFAVVADEVRTLATRTQASTNEISSIIDNLQASSQKVSNSMRTTRHQSDSTLEKAELTRQALTDILSKVKDISELNHQIADASSQQATATDEINQNITNMSESSSSNLQQAEDISQVSEQLIEHGNELENLMNQFKTTK